MSSASHMAPFVAAVLRDKTVEELMHKVKQQEQQIKDMMKVEITGPDGSPVYKKGQFDRGDYYWKGSLNAWHLLGMEKVADCPVQDLRGVEVRLGGIVQFTFDPEKHQSHWHFFERDDGPCFAISTDYGLSFYASIEGWEESLWQPILEDSDGDWYEEADDALEMLESLPTGCVIAFTNVVFRTKSYRALLDKVPLSKEQLQMKGGLDAVMARVKEIAPQLVHEVHYAIYFIVTQHLNIRAVADELELVLPSLVEIYNVYHGIGDEDFDRTNLSWKIRQEVFPTETMEAQLLDKNLQTRPLLLQGFVDRVHQMAQRQRSRQQK